MRANRGDFPEAERPLREAMAIQQRIAPGDAAMWGLLVDLAYLIHGAGDNQKGQATVVEAMKVFRRLPVEGLGNSRADLLRMAELLGFSREWNQADSIFTRLVDVERTLAGPRTTQVAAALTGWAGSMRRRGNLTAADSMLSIAVAIYDAIEPRSLGAAHVLQEQSSVALQQGALLRADSLARVALGTYRDRLGEDHREVAAARVDIAHVLQRRGLLEESIDMRRLAHATFRRNENDAVVLLPASQWRLAVALRATGRLEESLGEFRDALGVFEAKFPATYLMTANVRRDYGDALVDAGRPADAERMLRQAIDVLAGRWGKEDQRVDMARISLGQAIAALGRRDEARRLLVEAMNRLAASHGADDSVTRRARGALESIERPRPGTPP